MEKVYDKLILYFCCSIFLINYQFSIYSLIPAGVALFMCAIEFVLQKEAINIFCFAFYASLSLRFPLFIYFLPLMNYDLLCEYYSAAVILGLLPFLNALFFIPSFVLVSMPLLTLAAYLLKKRTLALTEVKKDYLALRDDMLKSTERLRTQNKDLLEKQDYEINNATLNERNRIAREIHDTVGHLLSSSLLQIGALLAICKDNNMKKGLTNVKETLSTGMDNIRASIHNLHEDSMDLNYKLQELIHNFNFCPVNFSYEVTHDMKMKAKYSIISIVKEALSNVMKHSDATQVGITLKEENGCYRLIIQDNGTKRPDRSRDSGGMGIQGMLERVNSLDGHFHIDTRNGFQIFIELPKSQEEPAIVQNKGGINI